LNKPFWNIYTQMINFMFSSHVKISGLVLLAVILLQGCGGERTTPYDPGSSSSSSSAVSVTAQVIAQATTVSGVLDHSDKRLQVMRNENDFFDITDGYVNFNLDSQNFTNGQVVLLDLGEQDSCKQRLDFNSLRAQESGGDSVKVVVTYRERAATSGACTSVLSRPFYLYYVQSRGTLIFEESIL
jgi:hypothetical protein